MMDEKTAIKIATYRMAGIGPTEISRKLKLNKYVVHNWIAYFRKQKMTFPSRRLTASVIADKLRRKHADWFSGS